MSVTICLTLGAAEWFGGPRAVAARAHVDGRGIVVKGVTASGRGEAVLREAARMAIGHERVLVRELGDGVYVAEEEEHS